MKDLKESGLYLILSIVVVSGVLGVLLLLPTDIIETSLCVMLSIGVFLVFCYLLGIIDGITKYPLKSTFLDDLNNR